MSQDAWTEVDRYLVDTLLAPDAALDANAEGVRRMYELIAAEPRVTATAVQTVGSKGWDGFCLIRVN